MLTNVNHSDTQIAFAGIKYIKFSRLMLSAFVKLPKNPDIDISSNINYTYFARSFPVYDRLITRKLLIIYSGYSFIAGQVPVRFNVAIMIFMTCFISYMLRVNISINILGMAYPANQNETVEIPDVRILSPLLVWCYGMCSMFDVRVCVWCLSMHSA